jgi:diketogulonate reductase-like aldo/keto reductase
MRASAVSVSSVEANGARIPAFGLGTWALRGRTCTRMVEEALRLGYRHIDTAEMYENEREVGEGLRASGVPREEVFITTKVWSSNLAPDDLARSARQSVAKLNVAQVDLLLIHWPNPRIPLAQTIPALCKAKTDGLARHIGVSNFDAKLVNEAVRLASESLVNDQIEWHPFIDQSATYNACRKHGLAVTAYSPVAKGRAANNKTLAAIGARHGKTATQVALRFLLQEGAIVIPRTSRSERLAENFDVFDFTLSAAEMSEIRKLAR